MGLNKHKGEHSAAEEQHSIMPWPKPSEARRCSSGSPSSRRTTSLKQHEVVYVSSARLARVRVRVRVSSCAKHARSVWPVKRSSSAQPWLIVVEGVAGLWGGGPRRDLALAGRVGA